MRARKITAINAHEKMSPVYGHGWQTECSYLRRKARFKFSAILAQPHHSEHPTFKTVLDDCEVIESFYLVGCCEGNEPHQTINSTAHPYLLAKCGRRLS